jgi:hypothetical protein
MAISETFYVHILFARSIKYLTDNRRLSKLAQKTQISEVCKSNWTETDIC